jgi:hypothetical protein
MNVDVATLPFDLTALDHEGRSASSHLAMNSCCTLSLLDDESDARPLPASGAASLVLDKALSSLLPDTRLEANLTDLLWSFVGLFLRRRVVSATSSTTTRSRKRRLQASFEHDIDVGSARQV